MRTKNIYKSVSVTSVFMIAIIVSAIFLSGCGDTLPDSRKIVEVEWAQSTGALIGITEDSETCFTLYAGQTIDSGTVCISVDNTTDTAGECGQEGALGTVNVEYTTSNGWELVEAHLAVGDDLSDIPTTRKGNPKIGNFPYHSGDITIRHN